MQPLIDQYNIKYRVWEGTVFIEESENILTPDEYELFFAFLNNNPQISILDFGDSLSFPNCFQGLNYIELIKLSSECKLMPRFIDCPKLNNIETPSISEIGCHEPKSNERIFHNCPSLLKIKFNSKLNIIHGSAFTGVNFKQIDLRECNKLEIRERAFQSCQNLERIYLPPHIQQLKCHVFAQCNNLEYVFSETVVSITIHTFNGCYSLKEVPYYVDVDLHNKKYRVPYSFNGFFEKDSYGSGKTGIVLRCDNQYMYIWSFTDFRFYQTDSLHPELVDCFILFKHDHSLRPYFKNNKTYFTPQYKLNKAIEISKINSTSDINIGRLSWSSPYKITHRGGFYEDDWYENNQLMAIENYINELNSEKKSMIDIIAKIKNDVDALNISQIIDSYHTLVLEDVQTKVGGDDTFTSFICRCSEYSDEYLKTLLPNKSTSYRDRSYTSSWPWTSQKKKEEMKVEDEILKKEAYLRYNKEEHINCLVDSYIDKLCDTKFNLEKYCHIESARMLLNRYTLLKGANLVDKLNGICSQYYW